ncbi:D-glycero-beta-D-manno-heptose 1-phosphate adenylyltransferase [Lachnospiraceae bacterium ASD4241]|uniref:Bifunctional protein HldE n=1 Tax=Diplocloster modestus TaxID=2850322 RepID=A0ABS6K3Y5_9FIRM|nr:D-glycero-beta-D-manno-heptose 1-phosphate adenylyltransferase [Diplocloster modestus]
MQKLIKPKNILVIGDVMIDTYYRGNVRRISPEAPVPVFHKVKEYSVLGGAANVAANLTAAGQHAAIMSVIGNDSAGKHLCDLFSAAGIDYEFLMRKTTRTTTVKTRLVGQNHQQLLRVDDEDAQLISAEDESDLIQVLLEGISHYDLVILSDYLKGLFTLDFTQKVLKLCRDYGIAVIIDVKDTAVEKYDGAFLLKPNRKELHALTQLPVDSINDIKEASFALCSKCHAEYVLTTCGADGMVLVAKDKSFSKIDCVSREVYDVTGAGDTVIAYLAAGLANHLSMDISLQIANAAAGIQVSKVGTSSVSVGEVERYFQEETICRSSKIIDRTQVQNLRNKYQDKKIVFTNGCFDLLHIGHVRYLQEAAKLGEILIIGVNSDSSVRRLKGENRPVNNQTDRMEILAALEYVDYVVLFDEDTPLELIKEVQPDFLVKGGDYRPDEVVGRDIVEARGGCLKLIPFIDGISTSEIIKKINDPSKGLMK